MSNNFINRKKNELSAHSPQQLQPPNPLVINENMEYPSTTQIQTSTDFGTSDFEKEFFSKSNLRKLWCCVGIFSIPATIYLIIIISLFYFDSRHYNGYFLRVEQTTLEIKDATNNAIKNFNTFSDRMSSFSNEHPQLMIDMEQTLHFVAQFSHKLNNSTSDEINVLLDNTISFIETFKNFINDNKHFSDDVNEILSHGKNFTYFLDQLTNKFTHW